MGQEWIRIQFPLKREYELGFNIVHLFRSMSQQLCRIINYAERTIRVAAVVLHINVLSCYAVPDGVTDSSTHTLVLTLMPRFSVNL